jgi:hypothetical protein
MSGKSGGSAGGGKQDARKVGNVKGGGRNKEQDRRATEKMNAPETRTAPKG